MMNEFRRFFFVQALIVAACLAALFGMAVSYTGQGPDAVAANDRVQTVKENWDDLKVLDDRDLGTEILVFDRDDQVVYASSETAFQGINSPLEAMRNHLVTMPVNDEEVFLGTIVFPDPSKTGYDHMMATAFMIIFLAAAVLLFSYAVFFYYVDRKVIKPFRRMKKAAALIAQGRLDEPLIMERSNIFGIFTESFDTMREELRASKERELALAKKEKELVASLSHDLKTPVTGIKLICELLEVKVEDGYVKEKILGIDHKTEEMNVLLNNLLSSALEDVNEMNVHCREVSSDILMELLDEHDPHKKTVTGKIPGCIINVDRNRLSQVIGNIISNSYKYADTRIDVSYRLHDDHLEMSLLDHGEGVNAEEVSLLTDKFYRGKSNADEKEGSGLGLYISKELMEKMEGQLICRSGQEGFCVTLMLPLA